MAQNTHLVVKEEYEERARQLFRDTNTQISIHRKCHLGAALGSRTFTKECVHDKVQFYLDYPGLGYLVPRLSGSHGPRL